MTSRLFLVLGCLLLAGCGTPKNYVVLLPEPDEKPTALTLTTGGGSARLEKPGEAVGASSGRAAPEKVEISREDVQRTFGAALAAAPKPSEVFLLEFNFRTSELTPDSQARLPQILQAIGRRPAPEVSIVGHTDQAGDATYNYQLGLRRAQAVREQVVGVGVDPTLIDITSHGANNPLVPTPPGRPEPRNRRVEVTVR